MYASHALRAGCAMAKPLSADSISYIVIGYDADGTHIYHLRANAQNIDRIRIKFEILAEHNGWKPFTRIDVIRLSTDEELESIAILAPEEVEHE